MSYILKHGDIMSKIKNIEKKLKIDLWTYGTNKVKVSIKTKQLLMKVIDNYMWLDINIMINKSYSVNNEWFIFIHDPRDVDKYFKYVHECLINIGATVEDHRDK